MKHFKSKEFHGFYKQLSPELKEKLDLQRDAWGAKIYISKAPGAVGRRLGVMDLSRHNIDKWGEVQAVDVMPEGLECAYDVGRFIEIAKKAGFGGIGFYPHWRPWAGFHLDVRPGPVKTWGRVGFEYVGIQTAIDAIA